MAENSKVGRRLGWNEVISGKVLSSILVLALVSALVVLGYVLTVPPRGEPFTEFFILSSSRSIENYPSQLKVGEEGKVTVDIVNREYETVTYRFEVRIDGMVSTEVGPLTLENGEQWEDLVSFTPETAGDRKKVELLLYKEGQPQVYRTLYFWMSVQ